MINREGGWDLKVLSFQTQPPGKGQIGQALEPCLTPGLYIRCLYCGGTPGGARCASLLANLPPLKYPAWLRTLARAGNFRSWPT